MLSQFKPLFRGVCSKPLGDYIQPHESPFSVGFRCNIHASPLSEGLHAIPMQVPFQRSFCTAPWELHIAPCKHFSERLAYSPLGVVCNPHATSFSEGFAWNPWGLHTTNMETTFQRGLHVTHIATMQPTFSQLDGHHLSLSMFQFILMYFIIYLLLYLPFTTSF